MAKDNKAVDRRKARIRRSIRARAYGKPRLSVFRSSKQIYAQIIDDVQGRDARGGLLARKGSAHEPEDRRDGRSGESDRQADCRRASQKGIKERCVRSRRLHVSWARQGARGCGTKRATRAELNF